MCASKTSVASTDRYKIRGSLSASTAVGGRRVCSQLPSRSVCGHSTIVAWCVRVIQQSSSSSPQTTIVGPTKVAWCVLSLMCANCVCEILIYWGSIRKICFHSGTIRAQVCRILRHYSVSQCSVTVSCTHTRRCRLAKLRITTTYIVGFQ